VLAAEEGRGDAAAEGAGRAAEEGEQQDHEEGAEGEEDARADPDGFGSEVHRHLLLPLLIGRGCIRRSFYGSLIFAPFNGAQKKQ